MTAHLCPQGWIMVWILQTSNIHKANAPRLWRQVLHRIISKFTKMPCEGITLVMADGCNGEGSGGTRNFLIGFWDGVKGHACCHVYEKDFLGCTHVNWPTFSICNMFEVNSLIREIFDQTERQLRIKVEYQ